MLRHSVMLDGGRRTIVNQSKTLPLARSLALLLSLMPFVNSAGALAIGRVHTSSREATTRSSDPLQATYQLSTIQVTRYYPPQSEHAPYEWWNASGAIKRGEESLGLGSRNFQMGWDFQFNINVHTHAKADVNITQLPTTLVG